MGFTYDDTFAVLAIKFIETGDSRYLREISESDAAWHIFNHATHFNQDVPKDSKMELVTYLLAPADEHRENLPQAAGNLDFAKKNIAGPGIAEKTALEYLPKGFTFTGSVFFTFGYDIGVAFGKNCSLNLINPIFLTDMNEISYYAIHEMHHAGFITLKGGYMPSLNISSCGQMASVIEYLTHMEGMGTYAPLDIRERENAMDTDNDYVILQDSTLVGKLEDEYFDIYRHFKNNPGKALVGEDWNEIGTMFGKRLFYTVGAHMARTIDRHLGREKLTDLIPEPSENFITAYLGLS